MDSKTILITGATDGIGLQTAEKLKSLGHNVIVHGRNQAKLYAVSAQLDVPTFKADFADLSEAKQMAGKHRLDDFAAYAQSKLAITVWSKYMAKQHSEKGPIVIAVNPGSLLGTKMVKEGFNTSGKDISIGVSILQSLSLDSEHAQHSGDYFDNDLGQYAQPHASAFDETKSQQILELLDSIAAL